MTQIIELGSPNKKPVTYKPIEVGTDLTEYVGTDCYAYQVIAVEKNVITCRAYKDKVAPGTTYYDQEYVYDELEPGDSEHIVRKFKLGRKFWSRLDRNGKTDGRARLSFGVARNYRDPSF
jgi:hypothetical protein